MTHSQESAQLAAKLYFDKRFRLTIWICEGLAFAFFLVAFIAGFLWFLIAGITMTSLAAAYLRTLRASVMKAAAASVALFDPPTCHYVLTDETISETTSLMSATVDWKLFAGLIAVDGFLLLQRQPVESGTVIVFPVAQLPDDARAFLMKRFASRSA